MSFPMLLKRRPATAGALTAVALFFALPAGAQFLGAPPAAAPTPAEASSSAAATEITTGSVLLPGDAFEVQIYNVPQFDYKGRIEDDGSVSLPLAGKLQLGGQTVAAAQQKIARALVDGNIIKSPQVSLRVTESPNRIVTVSGEVKTPGPVPVYGDKHLLDVLAAAGGLTPASSPVVTIYRHGSRTPLQVELPTDPAMAGASNVPIYPGDSVIISRLGVVYVLGAFHQQGALPLRNNAQVSLIEAMSLAGGVNYEAALNKAFLLRATPSGRVEIPFNVSKLLKHQIADQILQNEDIILIPTNNMKAALKGGAAGIAASLVAGIGYITVK